MAKCSGFLLKLVAFAFLCMMVDWPQCGEAAVNCDVVEISLVPRDPYIKSQPDRPECCPNIRSMVDLANRGTTADRQAVCNCLKRINSGLSNADIARANTLMFQSRGLGRGRGLYRSTSVSAETSRSRRDAYFKIEVGLMEAGSATSSHSIARNRFTFHD